MDIFNLSPEQLSILANVISIAISNKYTDDDQLGIIAIFLTAIGDNLALIQLQRITLAAQIEKARNNQNSDSNEADV